MQFLPMRYQLLVVLRHPVFTIRNWWNTQRARRSEKTIEDAKDEFAKNVKEIIKRNKETT